MYRTTVSILTLLLVATVALAGCAQPVPIAPADGDAADTGAADPDTDTTEGTVPGGVWTEASSADASTLNPILWADDASNDVGRYLYPTLIGQDPNSGEIVPTQMAESWEVSDDGLTWTFTLREGVIWSDGEAIDANDFKYTYDAVASELVETPRKSLVESIETIEVIDDYTVAVTFSEVKCDGLLDLGLRWLPSHLYAEDFSDIMESPLNEEPTVSGGEFLFQSWARDDNLVLVRNDDFWEGAPLMDGRITKVVPDPGARLAQLQSDESTFVDLQPEQLATVNADPNIEVYNFRDDGYDYIGLNLADPANPQPGQDEDGNLVEQDPHPILSDLNVRKAIAHALDYDAIIESVYLGQGYQIAANVLPIIEWAYDPSLQPYAYDPERAAALLEEAGWVDSDGDGVRDKDGEPLALELITNAGNTTREDLGVLVQDQLNSIGFDVDFQAIEFGALVEQLLGQTFDMVIIGWTDLGNDPNDDAFWHSKFDTPGSGFNFVSYQNPEIDQLLEDGVAVIGCDIAERAPFYQQIQQIIHDDVPYVFVSGSVDNFGYRAEWGGLDPGPWDFHWNIEKWFVETLQP